MNPPHPCKYSILRFSLRKTNRPFFRCLTPVVSWVWGIKKRSSTTLLASFLLSLSFAFFSLSLSLFTPSRANAAPPSSPYTPGETLNPTCSPGDSNCTVVAPPAGTGSAGLLTYWSASSTVSSSLSLFWDNPNIRLGIGTSQPSSTLHIIAGTTGATTLQLLGLPNQTGNLLTIGSSSGQRYFTVSSLGLASSTEFRSPSSTIDTLFLTSASSTNLSLSGYGLFSTLLAQNAVGLGSLSTSTSLVFIQGTQVASTTLNLRGTTNQTANLLTIASSTGINFFTIGPTGLASSTEFRANSSTIASLYDFNGNKYATSSAFTAGVDTQLLFGALGGGATSSIAFTITTSTSQLLFTGSNLSIASAGTSTSIVFLQGSQITSTTLNIFGTAAQTASLLTISSSTGIPLFNINALGQVAIATSTYPSSSTLLTIASSSQIFNISSGGNIMIGTSTSPNGALLQIATTTNIFTILNSGNLGIGTVSPSSKLHIAGNPLPIASSTLFLLGNNFISGGSTTGTFLGINATSGLTGFDFLNFQVNSSTKFMVAGDTGAIGVGTSTIPAGSLFTIATSSQIFNISSGGNIMIGTSTSPNGALLTIATSTNILTVSSDGTLTLTGGRIAFPATQSASTGANTLDDYEEGTWTPTIGADSQSGQVYSQQIGYYIKIGKLVFAAFDVRLSTEGTITGNANIGGFPFTSRNFTNRPWVGSYTANGLATNWLDFHIEMSNNATTALLRGRTAAATGDAAITSADITDSTFFSGTLIYEAAN